MFQSSWTSWSSKIMVLGTVESSHRMSGSLHDSRCSRVYSSKFATSPGGGTSSRSRPPRSRSSRSRMNSAVSGGTSSAYTWSPISSTQSGQHLGARLEALGVRPQRVDAEALGVFRRGGSVYGSRWGAPTRHDPNTRRTRSSPPRVTMRHGGRPSSGGHTSRPSRRTAYRCVEGPAQALDQHQRVVVPLDVEGALARAGARSTSHGPSVSTQTVASWSPT